MKIRILLSKVLPFWKLGFHCLYDFEYLHSSNKQKLEQIFYNWNFFGPQKDILFKSSLP